MLDSKIRFDLDAMRDAAGEASELLKSLSNPNRLLILCQLADREHSVGELAEHLDIRDTVASQHLALLRKDGLVTSRRDGQTIWYSLAETPARDILLTLFRIYCGSAGRKSAGGGRTARSGRKGP